MTFSTYMKNEYAIVAEGLRKSFGDNEVLKGVDLKVQRGTMLALLGPNGAGKTTTVRILSTLLSPDGGVGQIEGFDVARQAEEVRNVIGLTGQYAAVDEYLTGRQNLLMMGRLYRLSKADAAIRAEQLLEQFDLVDAAGRVVKTYSGGMRRRLDLAISLIATPPIIFLDEPTTGLDPRSRLAMWDVIRKLMESGATILLTTQYLEEADQLADKIAVIDRGIVIAEGTADELKQKVGNDRLELAISPKSDFSKAEKLIRGVGKQVNERRRTVSIATKGGVKELTKVLNDLEKAGVAVDTLSLHKPTLDDVFLQLTGHGATSDGADSMEKEAHA
jgi:ABC-2 type transport system ATP-binding protein